MTSLALASPANSAPPLTENHMTARTMWLPGAAEPS